MSSSGQSHRRCAPGRGRQLCWSSSTPTTTVQQSSPRDSSSEVDTAAGLPLGVVLPTIEIEAWILAAIESVRGVRGISPDAEPPEHIESVRNAKGAITERMTGARGYVATADIPALFDAMDLELAQRRSPSMAKFVREVRRLSVA